MRKTLIERCVRISEVVDDLEDLISDKATKMLREYCYYGLVESTEFRPADHQHAVEPVESEWISYKEDTQQFYISCMMQGMSSTESRLLADAFVEHEFLWYGSTELVIEDIYVEDEDAHGDYLYDMAQDKEN